jgi:hypothetical protein
VFWSIGTLVSCPVKRVLSTAPNKYLLKFVRLQVGSEHGHG